MRCNSNLFIKKIRENMFNMLDENSWYMKGGQLFTTVNTLCRPCSSIENVVTKHAFDVTICKIDYVCKGLRGGGICKII